MKLQYLNHAKSSDVIHAWAKRLVDDLNRELDREPPIGSMITWPNADTPLGWLVCDGATVNTTDYPALFLALGNTVGATFDLPTAYPAAPESSGFQIIIRAK